MENEPLAFRLAEGVATLTFNRPAKKNAITHAMWIDIAARLGALCADTATRAIVLTGTGANFSAGADIAEFDTLRGDGQSARRHEAANSAAFAAVRNAPVPVIAAIRGICFGGGFGLAAAADLRIASSDAKFAVPAARLGLAYPVDAMVDIVASTGAQMAKYLTFSAATIDAEAALAAGFLLEIADDPHGRAHEIAASIAANAPLSVRASKAAIRATLSGDGADIASAMAAGDATFNSADYAEGRAAFKARRHPIFSGR